MLGELAQGAVLEGVDLGGIGIIGVIMALPDPFNSVSALLAFTSFEQGEANGQDSVRAGTFAFSQFENALRQSRYEIYRKTLRKGNDDFSDDRLEEIFDNISRAWQIRWTVEQRLCLALAAVHSAARADEGEESFRDLFYRRLRREFNQAEWSNNYGPYIATFLKDWFSVEVPDSGPNSKKVLFLKDYIFQ